MTNNSKDNKINRLKEEGDIFNIEKSYIYSTSLENENFTLNDEITLITHRKFRCNITKDKIIIL
jgi:hypothetical protein